MFGIQEADSVAGGWGMRERGRRGGGGREGCPEAFLRSRFCSEYSGKLWRALSRSDGI